MRKTYDVCCAVVSDLEFDARVWKEVRTLSVAGYRVMLVGCCYERSGRRYAAGESVDVVEVSLGSRNGKVSVLGRMQTLARIWIEILRTHAHAYHCHNIHVGPPMWLASRLRNKPLVYDGHELYGAPRRRTLPSALAALPGRAVEGAMVRSSDAVVTTNTLRADVLERRWHVSGVHVLGNVPAPVPHVEPLDPGFPTGVPSCSTRAALSQGAHTASRSRRCDTCASCTSSSSASDAHPTSRSGDRGRRRPPCRPGCNFCHRNHSTHSCMWRPRPRSGSSRSSRSTSAATPSTRTSCSST